MIAFAILLTPHKPIRFSPRRPHQGWRRFAERLCAFCFGRAAPAISFPARFSYSGVSKPAILSWSNVAAKPLISPERRSLFLVLRGMAMSLAVRAANDQQMIRDTVPREAKLAVFLRHGRDGRAIASTRPAAGLADVAGYFMSRCEIQHQRTGQ
jgi:hypothetical protein